MRKILSAILLTVCAQLSLPPVVSAGGFDRFFFDSSGVRVDAEAGNTVIMEAKLQPNCSDQSSNICVHWNLILDDAAHETVYSSKIKEAAAAWSGHPDLPLRMDYVGKIDAAPTSPGVDNFGNPEMSGNFIVSFNPPTEIIFDSNEVSKTIHYVVPDFSSKKGQIKWAGIYFNPKYLPERDYDLKSALLHEMGRSIGLAPSAVTNSVMYPIRVPSGARTDLSSDDILWGVSAYGGVETLKKFGQISGEVINGVDGSPWVGAHLQILSADKAEVFAKTLDRSLFFGGAFSRELGKFSFGAVPAGTYLLLAEPSAQMPAPLSLLDSWLKKFVTPDSFENEFYDGADQESNQEPIHSFSPQLVYYAATLNVTTGQENSGVTIVTNIADPKVKRISAKGAAAETLSKNKAPAQKGLASDIVPADSGSVSSSATGCSLALNSNSFGFNLLAIFFALSLLLPIRRGLRAK